MKTTAIRGSVNRGHAAGFKLKERTSHPMSSLFRQRSDPPYRAPTLPVKTIKHSGRIGLVPLSYHYGAWASWGAPQAARFVGVQLRN
jgi:hypothetical protein